MKGQKGPGQKHLYSRISYLYQASTYLANVERSGPSAVTQGVVRPAEFTKAEEHLMPDVELGSDYVSKEQDIQNKSPRNSSLLKQMSPSRHLINHLKAISLKSQIRLTPAMKHAMCKRCDSMLISGHTSTSRIENQSRGGKKPWADVLVVTCTTCGGIKRFPVGAKRQPRNGKMEAR